MRPGSSRVGLLAAVAAAVVLGGCAPAPDELAMADVPRETVAVLPASSAVRGGPPSLRATSIERVARQVTVRVRSRGCGRVGTASAVAIAPRLLVTNRHVVEGAESLELNYWDGTSATAQVRAAAAADDLALVRVSTRLPAVARLATTDPAKDASVLVVGYPNGREQTVLGGTVVEYARLRTPVDASPVIRLAAEIVPGNSGGAVVDDSGALVGVIFGVETETGYGLAIPVSAVRHLRSSGGTASATTC